MAREKKNKNKKHISAWEYLMLIFNMICMTDNLF